VRGRKGGNWRDVRGGKRCCLVESAVLRKSDVHALADKKAGVLTEAGELRGRKGGGREGQDSPRRVGEEREVSPYLGSIRAGARY